MNPNNNEPVVIAVEEEKQQQLPKPRQFCLHSTCSECLTTYLSSSSSSANQQIIIPRKATDNPGIDLHKLVDHLPKDILVKIYKEYILPHKFLQMYNTLMTNSIIPYRIRKSEFERHLIYFMYYPIKIFIMKHNPRLYTSIWIHSHCWNYEIEKYRVIAPSIYDITQYHMGLYDDILYQDDDVDELLEYENDDDYY